MLIKHRAAYTFCQLGYPTAFVPDNSAKVRTGTQHSFPLN